MHILTTMTEMNERKLSGNEHGKQAGKECLAEAALEGWISAQNGMPDLTLPAQFLSSKHQNEWQMNA